MSKKTFIISLIVTTVVFLFILGRCLDLEAQRVVNQFYPKDEQGIIVGNESVEITQPGNRKAIVLFHGFLDSPRVYTKVLEKLETLPIHADLYAPLLPFHGKNLETASKLNNQVVMDFVAAYINDLASKYDCITINGLSYSGSILTELALNNRLPKNIHLILEAPAIHVILNTPINQVRNQFYALWRNYCNYELFGCHLNYQGLSEDTKEEILNEDNLMYKVVSAVFQLFSLDNQLRGRLALIKQPYSIIMSQLDSRVSYEQVAEECQQNIEYCNLYSLPTAGHILHYGHNQDAFIKLLLKHNLCEIHKLPQATMAVNDINP